MGFRVIKVIRRTGISVGFVEGMVVGIAVDGMTVGLAVLGTAVDGMTVGTVVVGTAEGI